jgi:hypothetical protein
MTTEANNPTAPIDSPGGFPVEGTGPAVDLGSDLDPDTMAAIFSGCAHCKCWRSGSFCCDCMEKKAPAVDPVEQPFAVKLAHAHREAERLYLVSVAADAALVAARKAAKTARIEADRAGALAGVMGPRQVMKAAEKAAGGRK